MQGTIRRVYFLIMCFTFLEVTFAGTYCNVQLLRSGSLSISDSFSGAKLVNFCREASGSLTWHQSYTLCMRRST